MFQLTEVQPNVTSHRLDSPGRHRGSRVHDVGSTRARRMGPTLATSRGSTACIMIHHSRCSSASERSCAGFAYSRGNQNHAVSALAEQLRPGWIGFGSASSPVFTLRQPSRSLCRGAPFRARCSSLCWPSCCPRGGMERADVRSGAGMPVTAKLLPDFHCVVAKRAPGGGGNFRAYWPRIDPNHQSPGDKA